MPTPAPCEQWVDPPPAFYYNEQPQLHYYHPAEELREDAAEEEEEEEEDVVIPRPPSPAACTAGIKCHAVTLDSNEEEYLWGLFHRTRSNVRPNNSPRYPA